MKVGFSMATVDDEDVDEEGVGSSPSASSMSSANTVLPKPMRAMENSPKATFRANRIFVGGLNEGMGFLWEGEEAENLGGEGEGVDWWGRRRDGDLQH